MTLSIDDYLILELTYTPLNTFCLLGLFCKNIIFFSFDLLLGCDFILVFFSFLHLVIYVAAKATYSFAFRAKWGFFVPVFVLVLVLVLQQAATYSIAAVAGN